MLVPNATGDAMYGYSTSQDALRATVFATWVFARRDDRDEQAVKASLLQAQRDLQECTISPRLDVDKIVLPVFEKPRAGQRQRAPRRRARQWKQP